MISIAATADVYTTSTAKSRNLALDRARIFLTLVVLLHHAVIPYTHFGHTDPKSWIGFDMVVLATDSFFMAMFFFLSGLFVWPGLRHKDLAIFLRDRSETDRIQNPNPRWRHRCVPLSERSTI